MSADIVAAAVAIAFLAAACQSLTAFGFALVMVPLLSLSWEAKPAVVTSTVLGTLILLPLLYEVRGHASPSRVGPLFLGSMAGIPAGVLILDRIDTSALEVIIAVVVIIAALATYFSPRLTVQRPPLKLSLAVGGLSGLLRGATSMGGPPVVLYTLALEPEIDRFRATLLAFFLSTSPVAIAAMAIAGRVDGDVMLVCVAALPGLVLGTVAGRWARQRLPEAVFRSLVLGVLIASSGAILATADGVLV